MAQDPKDFRNPKVSDGAAGSAGGLGKWIGIALAALVALLLLAWLFGLFADDDEVLAPAGDDPVVMTD